MIRPHVTILIPHENQQRNSTNKPVRKVMLNVFFDIMACLLLYFKQSNDEVNANILEPNVSKAVYQNQ
jgi:hypothetical protein